MDADELEQGVKSFQRRAVARLISLVEREDPVGQEVLKRLHGRTGRAHVVGVTGSPGTGKSTLTDQLIRTYRREGKRVAVVAVDPSSPFSGGAILGDRIRMNRHSGDKDVFIRSMGTRGALGGLAGHTTDVVRVLDAAGFDVVIVETVGVGQAEVDIIRLADTVIVVLVPNLGDDVQAVKAGVMEIADVFVINKSDLDGADKVHGEVESAMALAPHPEPGQEVWWPPLVRTVAERGDGVADVVEKVNEHAAWSREHGTWHQRRHRRLLTQIHSIIVKDVTRFAFTDPQIVRDPFDTLVAEAQAGRLSPQEVAAQILAAYRAPND